MRDVLLVVLVLTAIMAVVSAIRGNEESTPTWGHVFGFTLGLFVLGTQWGW